LVRSFVIRPPWWEKHISAWMQKPPVATTDFGEQQLMGHG